MAFSVVTVLRQSLRRLATGPAFLLLVTLAVVQALAAYVPGQFVRPAPGLVQSGAGGPPLVFTANPLPVVASLLAFVVSVYLALVTIRVFAGQWGIVEREHLTRRVGFGLLNLFSVFVAVALVTTVAQIVLAGLLGIFGLVLWLVLFLALAAASFFAPAFVAVEDDDFLTAFRKSIGVLTRSPVQVAGLLLALAVVNTVLQAAGSALIDALGSVAFLGPLVFTAVGALGLVFLWITVARAYDHLDGTPA